MQRPVMATNDSTDLYRGPSKVISGGQTGADIAGLLAAAHLRIPTGGWVPKGCRTEAGPNPALIADFGCVELSTAQYLPRTIRNLTEADATLIFYRKFLDGGSLRTVEACRARGKAHLAHDFADQHHEPYITDWLHARRPRVLNIAGNRESKAPGIERLVFDLLVGILGDLRDGR